MSNATACERLRSRLRWAESSERCAWNEVPRGDLRPAGASAGAGESLGRAAACSHATTGGASFAPDFFTEYGDRHCPDIGMSQDLVTCALAECLFFQWNLKMCAMSQTPDTVTGILPRPRANALGYDSRRRTEACGIVAQNEQPRRRSARKTPGSPARMHPPHPASDRWPGCRRTGTRVARQRKRIGTSAIVTVRDTAAA